MTENTTPKPDDENTTEARRGSSGNRLVLLGATVGAVLGLLAYTQNWLG